MDPTVVSALVALVGTLVGSFSGILISNRLTTYRIEQLEKKVEKHNSVVERMFKAENDISTSFERIDDLKNDVKNCNEHIEKLAMANSK